MPRLWRSFGELRNRDPRDELAARVSDYRVTFGSAAGQRCLADICRRAGVMQTTYGEDGPHASAYREGRRRLALEIIETINTNPDAILKAAITGQTEELFP